jgi:WD40 repeat protein
MSVAFSSDGTQVLTGSWDSTVKLWNVSTGAVTRTFTGFTGVVYSAALSPDGTKVLTADASRYPKLWNAATGEKIRDLTGHTATPNSVRFSPDGTRALTGGVDNTAKLWDVATGTMIHTFTGHTGYVNCVAYSADGTKVATASSDTTARLETIPFTGTIVINGNRSATNNAQATLALGWYGFPGMKVVRMRFSNDGATWSAWETLKSTPTYSLPAGDGHKTVRVQYLDINNNRSGVVSDYIRLDTVPPTGSIVINNGDKTTTNQVVWPTLAWDDGTGAGVSRMRFSNNGSTWTGWMPFMSTYPYALPSITPGYYTVRVQYLDGANNYSPIYNDYIKLVAK